MEPVFRPLSPDLPHRPVQKAHQLLRIWKKARTCQGHLVVSSDVTWDIRSYLLCLPTFLGLGGVGVGDFSFLICLSPMLLYLFMRDDLDRRQLTLVSILKEIPVQEGG